MRGRGDSKFRRGGGSPGRWEGNDRGRGYVESPVSGRSASRSRSPPPRPRLQIRSGPPVARKEALVRDRPTRSYTSSDSSPSRGNSPSSSSSEGRKAPSKKPPMPGAYKKEMLQYKKKEKEMLSRLQAAEEELQAERASRETLQAKAEFLGDKVKTVAERSKNRGQMLVRLIQGFRQVSEAKNRLSEAEAELDNILEAATALMQNEEQSSRPPDSAAAKAGATAATAEVAGQSDGANANHQWQQSQWHSPAPPASQPPPQEPADIHMTDDGGRWTEAVNADGSAPGPKNMRSFKFNIKLPS